MENTEKDIKEIVDSALLKGSDVKECFYKIDEIIYDKIYKYMRRYGDYPTKIFLGTKVHDLVSTGTLLYIGGTTEDSTNLLYYRNMHVSLLVSPYDIFVGGMI